MSDGLLVAVVIWALVVVAAFVLWLLRSEDRLR